MRRRLAAAALQCLDDRELLQGAWKSASYLGMEIEGNKPDPSIFAHVVYLAAGAILVIIIAAIIIVSWRSHKKNTPPFTKHPVSMLVLPSMQGSTRA